MAESFVSAARLLQLSCFIFAFAVLFLQSIPLSPQMKTYFVMCDIGQGDAIIIRHGPYVALIDTGPNFEVLDCLQANISPFRQKIDLLIITHLDTDHVGGLESLLSRYPVAQIWWGGHVPRSKQQEEALEILQRQENLRIPEMGDELVLSGLRFRVVWNADAFVRFFPGGSQENVNNQSLGLFIMGNSFGFLSLGDLECEQELAVVDSSLLNMVSILKISHHGSKLSSCPVFLDKIQTEVALVSVGENNSYGHPEEKVIRNFSTRGVPVLRTDVHGSVLVQPDSDNFLFMPID